MRIVQLHAHYRQLGGEDASADTEASLLEAAGVGVERVLFDNWDIDSRPGMRRSLRAAAGTVWSITASRRLEAVLNRTRPDVVHFHNTFPSASPSVVQTASRMGYPVVVTLHNYRLGCLNAQLYREGAPCLDCVGRTPWRGVVHACYRASRSASLAAAGSIVTHRVLRTWSEHVDLFLTPSAFAARTLTRIGLDSAKLLVKSNAVGRDLDRTQGSGDYFVMVGRVTDDKGVADVVSWWAGAQPGPALKVVGDGPMLAELRQRFSGPGIEFLGSLPPRDVIAILRGARALAFASRLFEVQPMVILEAMASALPVLAPIGGAAEELVTHGRTGLLYRLGDWSTFSDHVKLLSTRRSLAMEMGLAGAARYEAEFSPKVVLAATLSAYGEVIARRKARRNLS